MKKNKYSIFLSLCFAMLFAQQVSANPYGTSGGAKSDLYGSGGSSKSGVYSDDGGSSSAESGKASEPNSTSPSTSTSAITSENSEEIFKEAIEVGNELIVPGRRILYGLSILAIMGVGGMATFGSFPKGWAIGIIGGLSVMMLSEEFATWIVDIAKNKKPEDFNAISDVVYDTTEVLSKDVSNLMYITSGIGVIGLSTMGFFGAMPWKWVGSLIAGLLVIAGSSEIVGYIVSGLENG